MKQKIVIFKEKTRTVDTEYASYPIKELENIGEFDTHQQVDDFIKKLNLDFEKGRYYIIPAMIHEIK